MQVTLNTPLVSICIPTYNGVQYLDECITSVRAQSFSNFEVVICDDHSSDGTLELAEKLADGDSRFRFIRNPRRYGLVGNWNNCIEQSKAEWIKFVFQDDVISPRCLEKLLAACEKEDSRFAFCERDFIFDEGVPGSLRNEFDNHRNKLEADYGLCSRIEIDAAVRLAARGPNHNPVGEPTVTLIKKSLIQDLGAFDESLVQLCDAEFWWRAMVNGCTAHVPEVLASFRIHGKAATANNIAKNSWRLSVLDPLVMHYRLAFDPRMENGRVPQLTGRSVLRTQLGWAKSAVFASASASTRDWGQMVVGNDWLSICRSCPGLRPLAWLGRGIAFSHKIKATLGLGIERYKQSPDL